MSYTPIWTPAVGSSPGSGSDDSPTPQYVNSATMSLSQWDLSINFRIQRPLIDSTGANTGIASDGVVQVIMSPTHAKVLARLLEDAMQEWENRFGILPDVEHLMPRPVSQQAEGGATGEVEERDAP